MEATLTYSPSGTGWTSFHSYLPEYILGMNSIFYTFKNGDLYKHHDNATRNNYYGAQYSSTVTPVFNDQPIEAKMFKVLEIEGTDPWDVVVTTDLTTGFIDKDYFVKKEGAYYANILRNPGSLDLRETSAQGIGDCIGVTGTFPTIIVITFANPVSALISPRNPAIGGSIGDVAYVGTGVGITAIGDITAVSTSSPYTITIATSVSTPVVGDFIMFLKNSQIESYGARGYYADVKLTNSLTTETELFSVSSEVFQSFP